MRHVQLRDRGREGTRMNRLLLKIYVSLQKLKDREDGQDMVEYALVVAVIGVGASAFIRPFALVMNNVFILVGNTVLGGV